MLVNEFGEIGIDNDLIVTTDEDMVELSNGCICCSINDELMEAVERVIERPEPLDYIVVETTGGFHDDVIERLWAFNHPFHRLHQLVVDRAADATVAQFHHVFIGGDDQIVVDADFTELIHQHRGLHSLLIAQDVIQQGGFPSSEEAAEDGDRSPSSAASSELGKPPC